MTTGQIVGDVGSIPKVRRMSFCQPTSRHALSTAPRSPRPTRIAMTTLRTRPRSPGIPR